MYEQAVGGLGWSPSEFYEATPREVFLALRGKSKADRDFFEVMAHVVTVGYARTQTKKEIKLFKDEHEERVKKINPDKKKTELDFLQEKFKK